MSTKKNGILVTGTHRSGTTWMGRILSLPDEVVYIHEPFNLETSTESIPFKFKHWFPHTKDIPDRDRLYQAMETAMNFNFVPTLPDDVSMIRKIKAHGKRRLKNLSHKLHGRRPLFKDPIALLSADDIATRLNLDVVCMIRHPLAFCGSVKKWNWKFPFADFQNQPKLMETHFRDHKEIIAKYTAMEQPIVHQATLLWNLFHKVIRNYQEKHPDWKFRRHMDVVADPVSRFNELYQELGLNFTDEVAKELQTSVSAKSGETAKSGYSARNASTITQTWKKRLTDEEAAHILKETEELRLHFYPEERMGNASEKSA